MPACFRLYRKNDPTKEALSLIDVDQEICQEFNAPVHPTKYYNAWFDDIGFSLAIGWSFVQMLGECEQAIKMYPSDRDGYMRSIKMIEFMMANYEPETFYSPR